MLASDCAAGCARGAEVSGRPTSCNCARRSTVLSCCNQACTAFAVTSPGNAQQRERDALRKMLRNNCKPPSPISLTFSSSSTRACLSNSIVGKACASAFAVALPTAAAPHVKQAQDASGFPYLGFPSLAARERTWQPLVLPPGVRASSRCSACPSHEAQQSPLNTGGHIAPQTGRVEERALTLLLLQAEEVWDT